MMGPPHGFGNGRNDSLKPPKPKTLKEVPGYLRKVIGGFFSRLFYVIRLVWDTRPWILIAMTLLAVVNGVLPIFSALISAALINALAGVATGATSAFSMIIGLLVMQFTYIFLSSVIRSIGSIVTRLANQLVVNHIKLEIMNKAKTLDLRNFDIPEFYAKLENANQEAGMRPLQILSAAFDVFSSLISIFSFIAILSAISAWAPLVIVVLAVPTAVINFIYRKKNVMYMRFRSKDRRQMDYYSNQLVDKDVAKEIRMFGLADLFIERFKDTFSRYFAGMKKLILQENGWHLLMTAVSSAVNCLLFLYIAQKVFAGQLQVGDYSLYTGALNSISGGVGGLISTTASIYEGSLFIENLIAFMKEKTTIVPSVSEPVLPERGTGHVIEFSHVSFHYPGSERLVIRDVSFRLAEGETCVLVGLNGAGKTTLIKLLTRLYDPTDGQIFFDGRDIREYDVDALYQTFGIIFQDFGKYAFSVSENIAFGDVGKGIVTEDVKEAASQSNASDFIENLPDKYDTPLMRYFEDTGTELSIGQWQKLAIARAFYGESDILILDEPTASLDPMAEQEIFNQFDRLRNDKTTIFVSHRLSSATIATKILVLESGCLVEEGTHSELMALGGKYYTLFSTQAKRYIENAVPESPAGTGPATGYGEKETGNHEKKEGFPKP